MGEKEFSEIKNRLLKLENVKATITPDSSLGFPEKRFAMGEKVSKDEHGKKKVEQVSIPLVLQIVVGRDDFGVRQEIENIIGSIPYEILKLSPSPR